MYKQVIIVRNDLKLGKGKLISQALHAAIGSMKKVDKKLVDRWEKIGSKKVILKVKDLEEMKKIEKKVREEKISYFLVKDAGLTQLESGTITALGIGPIEERKIDKITGKLKLL
jgi:PTH2 family peptidyl-tRNA hydrolase